MIGFFGSECPECHPLVSQQLYLVSVKGHCTKMSFSFMVQCSPVCSSAAHTSNCSSLHCFTAFPLCCSVTIWPHLLLSTTMWTLIFPISRFFFYLTLSSRFIFDSSVLSLTFLYLISLSSVPPILLTFLPRIKVHVHSVYNICKTLSSLCGYIFF